MFDLKRPCTNCPFRIGTGSKFRLHPERLEEIRTASAFQCHKTVDYSEDEPGSGDRPQQCAGLMSVMNREETPNQIMRVGQRVGVLDVSALDPAGEAYASWEDVLNAHRQGREPS